MNRLYVFKGDALFFGDVYDPEPHAHHVLEIFVALDRPLVVEQQGQKLRARNIVVDADQTHRVLSEGNRFAILLLDPESATARQVKKAFLVKNAITILPDSQFLGYRESLSRSFECDLSIETAKTVRDEIIACLLENGFSTSAQSRSKRRRYQGSQP